MNPPMSKAKVSIWNCGGKRKRKRRQMAKSFSPKTETLLNCQMPIPFSHSHSHCALSLFPIPLLFWPLYITRFPHQLTSSLRKQVYFASRFVSSKLAFSNPSSYIFFKCILFGFLVVWLLRKHCEFIFAIKFRFGLSKVFSCFVIELVH